MRKITLSGIVLLAVVSFLVLIGLALLLSLFFIVPSPGSISLAGKVTVIPIKGDIMMEEPGSFSPDLGTAEIIEAIEAANADPTVGAIVLEINSGGGGVVASKQITQAIERCDKPTVAYISEVGASAAYYIAASADEVMADEDSITGSIGVISILPNIEGLLEEWGVEVVTLHEGEHKTMGSLFEKLSDGDKEIMQEILRESFQRFKNDIIEFRSGKMNAARFEEVADGRILSGSQAFNIGLVDRLGTKSDALDWAAELAGLEFYSVNEYEGMGGGLFELFAHAGSSFSSGLTGGLKGSSGIQS